MADITIPIVDEAKLHPLFKKLINSPAYQPGCKLIKEIAEEFTDIDGNLFEQFQTTGFNQRLWELFLFEFFKENKFQIRRQGNNPDFFIKKDGVEIAIEAVTSNPTDNDEEIEQLVKKAFDFKDKEGQKNANRHIIDQTTIKLGSPLFSKLEKRYWEKNHIKGLPLIFAIEAFHHSYANNFPDYKIASYLYGFEIKKDIDGDGQSISRYEFSSEYEFNGKKIPFGFFNLEEAKNISAVIFTNTGNIDKFNRIGSQKGYYENEVFLFRVGTFYTPDKIGNFEYLVGSGEHFETWSEGVSIFHNPNAIKPIPKEIFHPNRQIWQVRKNFDGHMPEFFPYLSETGNLFITE